MGLFQYIDKINIGTIVKKHIGTLVNANTGKSGTNDIITFIVIPVAVALALCLLKIELCNDVINIIIVSLSIFVGLLFNLIILIFDIVKNNRTNKTKNLLLEQILVNIAFTVLLSLAAIIATIFTYIRHHMYFKLVMTGIVYYLLTLFIVTLLMILKRMYTIFDNEMTEINKEIEDAAAKKKDQ
jgi:hypothetical protein